MSMDPNEKLEPIIPAEQAVETPAETDSPPDDKKEAEKSESPTGADVEGSSTEKDKGEKSDEPKTSLEAIEQAFAAEDGTKPKEEEPEGEGETKPENPEAAKSSAPTEDDLTTFPEELKEGTKAHERFSKLVNVNKEQTAKVEELTGHVDGIKTLVSDAGLDKTGFKELLDYAKEANTGDPKKALEMLDAQRNKLLLEIGEPIETPGPLDKFPDLKQKVEDHDLSESDAMKLAQADNAKQAKKDADDKAESDANEQASVNTSVEENRNKVIVMEQNWAKTDVDWAAKKELMATRMTEINAQPPEMWPILFKQAYDMISLGAKKSGKVVSQESPMGKGAGDGGTPEPKSSLEAMEQAFEAM